MKYTAKLCSCWCNYPNPNYNKDGHNKCLEQYKNINITNGISLKTHCMLIENKEDKKKK